MSLEAVPAVLRRTVRPEPGEGGRVQGAGQPATGRVLLAAVRTAFFGVFLAGVAAFWMAAAFKVTRMHRETDRFHEDFDRRGNANRARPNRDACGDPLPAAQGAQPRRDADFSYHDQFPLFGLIFLAAGVGMIPSPFLAFYRSWGTVDVVTDRRAVVLDGGWGTHVRSFAPGDRGGVERRQRGDSSGDSVLTRGDYARGHDSGSPGRDCYYVPVGWRAKEMGFLGIAQVHATEQLLRGPLGPRAQPGPPA